MTSGRRLGNLRAVGRRETAATLVTLALVAFNAAFNATGASARPGVGPNVGKVCDTSWKAPVDGDWGTASNWTNGLPNSPTSACITQDGTYTVRVAGPGFHGSRSLTLGAALGPQTVSIEGAGSRSAGLGIAPSGYRPELGVIRPHLTG